MVSVPKRTQEKLPEGGPEQIRKKGMIFDWNASSFERVTDIYLLIIYALFNPKVYGRVFKKGSYQFIGKFDTSWHKFHCHIRFNVLATFI